MIKKKTSLRSWINKTTVKKVSELLEVNTSTVRHWRSGHSLPQAAQMQKIKKITNGKVDPTAVIEHHFKKSKAGA